jgi:hypothetical protein
MVEVIGFYLILLHKAGRLDTSNFIDSFVAVAGSTLLGGLAYLAVARALESEEFKTLYARVPFLGNARA